MAQKQLNVRMDDATFDVLEAAAFVRGASLPDLIRPQIEALADSLAGEHAIKTALLAREEHRAAKTGKLSPLRSRHQDAEA
ncbi:MAG: hypothetical protein ACHQHO_05365 [Solirubrobacterales bacterium]